QEGGEARGRQMIPVRISQPVAIPPLPPREELWSHPRSTALAFDLPERLAVVIAEQELILAAPDLAREDRIHSLEPHLYASDSQHVALMKRQLVLVAELGQREAHFERSAVVQLQDQ